MPSESDRSRRNHFTGVSLDRRDEWRADASRVRALWPLARVVVVDFEGRALADGTGLRTLVGAELPEATAAAASFLGTLDEQAWFALPAEAWPESEQPAKREWIGLREAAARWDRVASGIFAYAKALLLWQTRARYCGACGHATALTRAGHSARCTSAGCGLEQFPRTDAAIIVIVTDGSRCLLGRQASWPAGRWSTLAGFVEPGESLEDAVRREVREEAGVRVADCHYQSSQPWPFPGALMVGFRATAADATIALGDELDDARWFEASELPGLVRSGAIGLPPSISISRHLIDDWLVEVLGAAAVADLRER